MLEGVQKSEFIQAGAAENDIIIAPPRHPLIGQELYAPNNTK